MKRPKVAGPRVSIAVLSCVAALALAAGALGALPVRPSATANAAAALERAQTIRAQVGDRYRALPAPGLVVTEATSTAVVESFSLLTPGLLETRFLSAANGIWYAICPVRVSCPYPARGFAREAADIVVRRVALELALRTFLETSADVVAVSLPTRRFTAFVVERGELASAIQLSTFARALSRDPSRGLTRSQRAAVDRLTLPRIFASVGLEPTPSGGATWAGLPLWRVRAGSAPSGASSAAGAGGREARPFQLVFLGRDEPAPANVPGGWLHVGPFTALGAFCPAGEVTQVDAAQSGPSESIVTRLHTCADGSGSVTALIESGVDEHGGFGAWTFVSGTGAYARLRGQGTFTSVRTSGGPSPPMTFRSEWRGVADLDDVGPIVSISQLTAKALARPQGAYRLRVAFSASDGPEYLVKYLVTIRGGARTLASTGGRTASGAVAAGLVVRPFRGVRRLRLEIVASDPFGNETTATRVITLRRR
jgi:hypothetical protein